MSSDKMPFKSPDKRRKRVPTAQELWHQHRKTRKRPIQTGCGRLASDCVLFLFVFATLILTLPVWVLIVIAHLLTDRD